MNLKLNKSLNYVAIGCLVVIAITFFLPFYEGWYSSVSEINEKSFGVVRIIRTGDGEADSIVYNGFKSNFAIFNALISALIVLGIFLYPKNIATAITSLLLMLICLVLVGLGCSAGFGAPFGDTMLYGFHIFIVAEMVLIVISFMKYGISEKVPDEKRDLLDS